MYDFKAAIEIIGINPFVYVPQEILQAIFIKAGKQKGPIPVHGLINGEIFTQTLVRYAGEWRLYINMKMLKNSPSHIGEVVSISIDYDEHDRILPLHPELEEALNKDASALTTFKSLAPYRQHEINRYITNLKSESKVHENVQRAIDHLNGKGKFAGR